MMADVRCPMCGKPNPADLETCQFCGARLKPLLAPSPDDSKPDKAVGEMSKNDPAKTSGGGNSPDSLEEKPSTTVPNEQDLPPSPSQTTSPDSSRALPDWLSGLEKAATDDEEEIPDWLTGLREEKMDNSSPEPSQMATGSLSSGAGDTDWEARLGNGPNSSDKVGASPQMAEPAAPDTPPVEEKPIDWLDSLKSQLTTPGTVEQPGEPDG